MGKIIMNGSTFGIADGSSQSNKVVTFNTLTHYNKKLHDELDNILNKINKIEKHLAIIDEKLGIEDNEYILVANDDASEFKIMLKGEYYE